MKNFLNSKRCLPILAVVFLMFIGPVKAQYFDIYCKESGSPQAKNVCYPATASDWEFSAGSYIYNVRTSNQKTELDALGYLKSAAGAPANCNLPVQFNATGGWIRTANNQSMETWSTAVISTGGARDVHGNCIITSTASGNQLKKDRKFSCLNGSQGPYLGPGNGRFCVQPQNEQVKTCNPVMILGGSKHYSHVYDSPIFKYFHLFRSYSSLPRYSGIQSDASVFGLMSQPKPRSDSNSGEKLFSADTVGWQLSYEARIVFTTNENQTNQVFNISIPGEVSRSFVESSPGVYTGAHTSPVTVGSLSRDADNFYYRHPDGKIWIFSKSGFLKAIGSNSGNIVELAPNASQEIIAIDSFGRSLKIRTSDGLAFEVIDPAGNVYQYKYNGGKFSFVQFPLENNVPSQFGYLYGDNRFLGAITGEIDEFGNAWARFDYGTDGKVVRTANYIGTQVVNEYLFSNGLVTDPRGNQRDYKFSNEQLSSQSQPAGSGCAASFQSAIYNADRTLLASDDFNRLRTCHFSDPSRKLERVRVEGLPQNSVCGGLDGSGVSLPEGGRKVSTQWHPDWRLENRIAEPGKITTLVYNGQPDPTAGNAIASCAPASALLPDGKPIAVLCKKVEQATTDANGAAGFSAASQPGVAARVLKWTYNNFGQVLTEDGPRTDVSDVTTYTYHAATAFTGTDPYAVGVTLGDLKSITNAAGTTQYTKYNKHGQLLESIDPNGVVSNYSYDLRQRMLSSTVGGQQTTYTYDPAGQLKKVTRPDTSWTGYDYDAAHRLVAVYDNLGNRIDYTLDNAGNRTAEKVKDPGGVLKRQLARSIDPLGRVQQTTGRE